MKRKRYTEEQIAFALRQQENGTAVSGDRRAWQQKHLHYRSLEVSESCRLCLRLQKLLSVTFANCYSTPNAS